ncbi:MAG: cupin domain-containing protein [Proteobacteria bacterium]|nr:cupin domain-containing protein [Pseudomonadota bacterium]
MPFHHPPEDVLFDYAAGSVREPLGLVVATHLALCPACRRQVRELETIGGALLEQLPGSPPRIAAIDALLGRLDEPEPAAPSSPAFDAETRRLVPAPLRAYLGASLKDIAWRPVTRGLAEHDLALAPPGVKTQLLRIRAGAAIPRHGHGGSEAVLVLDGGFSDELGTYARGDLALSDGTIVHRPVADADGDCLCLAVVEGGVRLAGPLGRLLNLFTRA